MRNIPPFNLSLSDTGDAVSSASPRLNIGERSNTFNIAAPGSNTFPPWLLAAGGALALYLIVTR